MKLVKYLFVLGSSIFVACGSPQQPIASPTPQEEIINNIALTSFPDRTFMIKCTSRYKLCTDFTSSSN